MSAPEIGQKINEYIRLAENTIKQSKLYYMDESEFWLLAEEIEKLDKHYRPYQLCSSLLERLEKLVVLNKNK